MNQARTHTRTFAHAHKYLHTTLTRCNKTECPFASISGCGEGGVEEGVGVQIQFDSVMREMGTHASHLAWVGDLDVCVCMCVHEYMCVCVLHVNFVCVYVHACTCARRDRHGNIHVCMYRGKSTPYTCANMLTSHTCTHTRTHTHAHTHWLSPNY